MKVSFFIDRPVFSAVISIVIVIVGIIGEYMAILFSELKDRPIYIVEKTDNLKNPEEMDS